MLLAIQSGEASFILRGIYAGTGIGLCFMHFSIGQQGNLRRYRIIALMGILGTAVSVALPVNPALSFSLFWAGLLVISGAYALWQVEQQQRQAPDGA